MLKNSHTDIVLHAAAFRAHIQQRQMRHILAFSQVTFAETCCLAGNCIVSYILTLNQFLPARTAVESHRIHSGYFWRRFCIFFFAFQQELTIGLEPITSSLQVMRTANCAMPAKVTAAGLEPDIISVKGICHKPFRPSRQNVRCRA